MTRSIRFIPRLAPLLAIILLPLASRAQSIGDYGEFYRMIRIGADERLIFCYPPQTPATEPMVLGVRRDTLGRPVQITRFRFGNADTRSDWATMRIAYTAYESINTVVERRTFFNASGMPVTLDGAQTEEIYRRRNGELVQRKIVDKNGDPVNDAAGVHRSMFKTQEPGTIFQEWYYANGKLHFGTGSDGPLRPFAAMPQQTYYRKFTVDTAGNLLREEVLGFDRKRLPFPGGELVHAYELNACGQPVRMTFLDADGEPMEDSSGVAAITFAYDDAGRMTEWSTIDRKGRGRGRREDGVASARYTFRAFDGVLVKQELFDADGDPVVP